MRKRIIDWIFTLQSQRGILGEKERRLYTYAYGLLLNKIAIYAIIAIVGTITGNWIGMFSFLLPFSDGKEVAQGEIGELIVKGPYTIQEYYRLLDNDKYFNEEGFYLSGDKVRKLEDGNLKVVGRVKEQINRAGEKIMPSELEELIIKHPDIMDCAVIGIEDEMLGNKICVYAVARKNISLLDIRKHLEEAGIAMFKLPDVLRLVKRIPVTAMKKVDKEALRILEKEHYE